MVPAHSVSGGERYVWVPTLLSGAQQTKAKRCLCLRSEKKAEHPNLQPQELKILQADARIMVSASCQHVCVIARGVAWPDPCLMGDR